MLQINDFIKISKKTLFVDGELVHYIDNNMIKEIKLLQSIIEFNKDKSLYSKLNKDLDFIVKYKEFAIVFHPIKIGDSMKWIPCLVYKYENELIRVVIRNSKCLSCDWQGSIANPTFPDLYYSIDDKSKVMNKLNNLKFLKCPVCGESIDCKVIWIEKNKVCQVKGVSFRVLVLQHDICSCRKSVWHWCITGILC